MAKIYFRILISSLLIMFVWFVANVSNARAGSLKQQPTVDIPTVTGTPEGATIRVNTDQDQINVRSGPSTDYDIIGIMIAGQTAPAFGRSAGGSWIQIGYPGVDGGIAWVYSPLVTQIRGSQLPIIEPPPTSTPRVTPTIDQDLAATFIVDIPATRLPTFTNPPPIVIPTLEAQEPLVTSTNFPVGLLVAFFGIIGVLGLLFSVLRGR